MIKYFLGSSVVKSMVSHFTDKLGKTIDEPKIGSILYTGLLAERSPHKYASTSPFFLISLMNNNAPLSMSRFLNL